MAANISYQVARDGLWLSGPAEVVVTIDNTGATLGPTTPGDLEVRLDNTVGWTKKEIALAMRRIADHIWDPINGDTSGFFPL